MKRYLVTGCAGFIASKVVEQLLREGHLVVGVDNFNDAYDPRLKEWRIEQFVGNPSFRLERLDITDREALQSVFPAGSEHGPYSGVINLAARAGVRPSVEHPKMYFDTNVAGTLNLLELCREHGVPKFVLASSSSLYGTHNPVPYCEDADTNRPPSPYAASKKAAEALCYTYHHLHGLDVTVFRYFTVYGPAGRPDMSVFRFIRRIAEDEPITVFGDGTQERDFTYIDDIVRGTVAGLKPLGYEVINLGGDQPIRLSAIIDQIAERIGRKPKIDYHPAHPADVRTTWANVTKAQKLLDWSPEITVEQGLARSVAWYRENRRAVLPLELGDR